MAVAEAYVTAVVDRIRRERPSSHAAVQRIKLEVARDHPVGRIPPNSTILQALDTSERADLGRVLVKKPTRSLSGVAIVTVQSPPLACPHGTCVFCPGGPHQGTAQSYTGHEPAARRAARHAFDAFDQARSRLAELERNGHPVDKVDLIIQGGTFPARPVDEQRAFVHALFDALNAHGGAARRTAALAEAHHVNETAASRGIGLTVETKPDWCLEPHVDAMLELGTTRVELGIQTLSDPVLAATNRGHTVAASYAASRIVRDAGLKLCYHLMPGLPGSDVSQDLADARRVFQDERLRPDMLKIYPTLVVPGTALERQWRLGRYEPLSDEDAAQLVARIKAMVPPWVRIQRVDRDIPTPQIAAGVLKTNLRQYAQALLGRPCRCLRCREAGRRPTPSMTPVDVLRTYRASGGVEHFLSIEDTAADSVVAYLRLRFPSGSAHRAEVHDSAIVREVKVVGREVPIDGRPAGARSHQHRGHGRHLMTRAERMARDAGYDRMLVTAGVGTRAYYARLGYERDGPYMAKPL